MCHKSSHQINPSSTNCLHHITELLQWRSDGERRPNSICFFSSRCSKRAEGIPSKRTGTSRNVIKRRRSLNHKCSLLDLSFSLSTLAQSLCSSWRFLLRTLFSDAHVITSSTSTMSTPHFTHTLSGPRGQLGLFRLHKLNVCQLVIVSIIEALPQCCLLVGQQSISHGSFM